MKRIGVFVVALALFLAGCSPMDVIMPPAGTEEPSAVPVPGGSLSLPVYHFDTWNPILTKSVSVSRVSTLIFEGLMRTGEGLTPEPCLAEGYSISSDGLVYTFFLRRDVTWHDGGRFRAQDVDYTVKTILASDSIYKKDLDNVSSGRVVDDYTYSIVLKNPMPGFISLADFPIIKAGTMAQEDLASYVPVGTGPYKYLEGSSKIIKLIANGSWWTGVAANINEIVVKILPDRESVAYAFDAREIEVFNATAGDLMSYNPKGNALIAPYTNNNLTFLGINSSGAVLGSGAVRRAISAAVDRDRLVKDIMFGHAIQSNIPINPESWLYPPDTPASGIDIEKAMQYLQADGWEAGGDGVMAKKGQAEPVQLSFSILVNEDNARRVAAAESIKKDLEQIGMNVTVQAVPFDEYERKVLSGDYEMFIGEVKIPKNYDLSMFAGKDAAFSVYQSENIEQLLESVRSAINKEDIKNSYDKLMQAFINEVPIVSLFFGRDALVYHSKLKGEIKPVCGNVYKNLASWYITEVQ